MISTIFKYIGLIAFFLLMLYTSVELKSTPLTIVTAVLFFCWFLLTANTGGKK